MRKILALLITVIFLTTSCNNEDDGNESVNEKNIVETYATIVYATYSDAHKLAKELKDKIETFNDAPTESNLQAAKDAWLNARNPYGQSEVFRFYGGPIDDADGPEGQLNAWPLDESYIDYVQGNVNGGENNVGINIINSPDEFPTIDKETIASLNEKDGETNVSAGYHAIEFLLWGQDLSAEGGGGERPATDFNSKSDQNSPEYRRTLYLTATIDLIIDDLNSLLEEWKPDGEYRKFFTSEAEVNNSFEKILIGMGKLSKGELAGERMFVSWDEKSKEDEHSCFSDNTHNDIINNALGIQNIYLGKYKAVDDTTIEGPGINALVKLKDEQLNTELTELLEQSVAATKAIQPPFDQEILNEPGRTRVKSAIDLLRQQGDKIAKVSALYGFTLDPSDI